MTQATAKQVNICVSIGRIFWETQRKYLGVSTGSITHEAASASLAASLLASVYPNRVVLHFSISERIFYKNKPYID